MTDSGASSGSTAKFGDSDTTERAMARPTAEQTGIGETEVGPLAISDDEMSQEVLVPFCSLKGY